MARLYPRYKIILSYNINQETHDEYFQFVTQEMVPAMQGMGIHMFRVYHTAYGDYPQRQVEFLTEDLSTIQKAFNSLTWRRLETKMKGYVYDYSRRVLRFRDGFQL